MSKAPIHNEQSLLERISRGDESAFRIVYDLYRKKIASFAFLLTESEDKADEILQEVFVKLWINRSRLPEVKNFNAWLHAVTRNLVVDALRRLARERRTHAGWAASTPFQSASADEIIFARENERILQTALQQLTPQQHQIYQLSREQGLKNDEIAERLGISALTVKNHLVNAMRTIRQYFRGHAELIALIVFLSR